MKITSQLTINAPIARVWKILAYDFATIGDWASGVEKSIINLKANVPEGATVGGRICQVPGFGDIIESFVHYDEDNKTYTYEATGMPFFVSKAFNTWRTRAIDAETTYVEFEADMQMMPVIGAVMSIPMRSQLTTILDNATEELKYFAETGYIHPRKQALVTKAMPKTVI